MPLLKIEFVFCSFAKLQSPRKLTFVFVALQTYKSPKMIIFGGFAKLLLKCRPAQVYLRVTAVPSLRSLLSDRALYLPYYYILLLYYYYDCVTTNITT